MTTHLRRGSSPIAYVGLTFAISWTAFGLWAISPGLAPLPATLLLVTGGLGPFAAALVLVGLRSDRSLRAWLRERFRLRVPGRYYLVALAVPPVAVLLAALVHVGALGGTLTPDAIPPLVEYPLFFGFIALLGGGLEEPGWRGYLLPALQARWRPLTAALLVGVVWVVWHLPLFFIPATVQASIPLWLYAPQVVAMSVVLTWVTNGARGAVLPAIFLHAGANAVVNYYPAGGVAGATSVVGYGLLTAVVVLVATLLVVTGTPGALGGDEPVRDPPHPSGLAAGD